ncbi:MAG TPA: glycerol kinase GlpK [Acidimicrobiia bacterium]|jgi:glycerol kinase|nr:glycerol kinase GlpK [Acidimicrobiia bacterium]
MPALIAVDAGTTGVRAFAVDGEGRPCGFAYRELTQHFPRPGWVEHDPAEIWAAVQTTLGELVGCLAGEGVAVAAVGITNQRETVVAWDRRTGRPLHRALVWQDRRTAARCDALKEAGQEPEIRAATGLVLDPYFSATKMEWLLREGGIDPATPGLALGTVDAWVAWNLTGGPDGGAFVTDPSNASRTLLYDIRTLAWSDPLCDLFGVPPAALPEVRPSSGRIGRCDPARAGGLDSPLSGIAGDQQAALFGHACFTPGMTKNTYGTGSFVLMNVGPKVPPPADGLLTTVAWTLADGTTAYALEGAVFVTGAAIQWLRDGLGIIAEAAETGPLAASVPDTEGVFLVPAFTGLGSPYWDPHARGALLGLTRTVGRAHLARAAVEAMAHQTRDVVEAMQAVGGTAISELRADGGAAVMDLLCQYQADLLGVPVRRPKLAETTALGATYLAGLAEGMWSTPEELAGYWLLEAEFAPKMGQKDADRRQDAWRRAVERAREFGS